MAIGGLVSEETDYRKIDTPDEKMVAKLPNARILLHADPDRTIMFELAVRSLIDGLHARMIHHRKQRPKAAKSAKLTGRSPQRKQTKNRVHRRTG
jgi:hypothetical protein